MVVIDGEKLTKDEAMNIYHDVLEYLDDLRESGVTNMFGATPYIKETFGFSERKSRDLLKFWMDTFSERHLNK